MTTTSTIVDTRNPLGLNVRQMKKSYWQDLDENTKKGCVGTLLAQTYDGKAAWTASGCLRNYWQSQLHENVKLVCNNNHGWVYKKDPHTAATAVFQLCLLGPVGLPAAAKPTIVVSCSNQKIATRTVNLLKSHPEIKKLKLGFGFVPHRDQAIIIAGSLGSGLPPIPHSTTIMTICGSRIISCSTPVHPNSSGKRSVLGGVLLLGNRYYGLTVAHTLLENFAYHVSEYNSSEDGNSLYEDSDEDLDTALKDTILDSPSVTYSSTISAVYLDNQNSPAADPESIIRESFGNWDLASSISLIGHTDARNVKTFQETAITEPSLGSRWFCLEQDWALVEIQDSRFMLPNTFTLNGRESMVRSIHPKQQPADNSLVFLANNHTEPATATAPETMACISLPWSRDFVDVWIVEFPSARGDCGTWVVEEHSGSLFGIVVATSADSKSTYVLPAEDIINGILARWHHRVTSSADLFPLAAASVKSLQSFQLEPVHEELLQYDEGSVMLRNLNDSGKGQNTISMQMPHSRDRADLDLLRQQDQDPETSRDSSTAPSNAFDPPTRPGRPSWVSPGISYAQAARFGDPSDVRPTGHFVGSTGSNTNKPMKGGQRDFKTKQAFPLAASPVLELLKARAELKDREAELAEQRALIERQENRIREQDEEIRMLKAMKHQQHSVTQHGREELYPFAAARSKSILSDVAQELARIPASDFKGYLYLISSKSKVLERSIDNILWQFAEMVAVYLREDIFSPSPEVTHRLKKSQEIIEELVHTSRPNLDWSGTKARAGVFTMRESRKSSGRAGLHERYLPRGNTVFTVGRVFALLWHENSSASKSSSILDWSVTHGQFGGQVLSSVRRMVVVKEDHGSCWCIPITTYNGRGLTKPGLSKSDISAHAIIHMEGTEPTTFPEEPEMNKVPITVKAASPDHKLDRMSRLNFGIVHTIQHNTRVMKIGNVTKYSMPYFQAYWKEQLKHNSRLHRG